MGLRTVAIALAAAFAAAVAVTVLRRRLDASGRDPIAPAPPRVTDFTR
ncbi:hypothetical protein [Gordonia crocea]|nr:hypothetical protein [Gordonia crocea]